MSFTETTSGAWTARLLRALTARGYDADALCRAAGVLPRLLLDPDARVPLRAWEALWKEAERRISDPCLGIHLGEAAPLDPYLIPGYTLVAAPSLAEFMRHHLALQRITFHTDFFALREERERSILMIVCPDGYAPTRQALEYTALLLARYMRQYFGIVPLRVTFTHAVPADPREHTRVFGCPLEFASAEDAFLFRREEFEKTRSAYSEETFGRLSKAAEGALAEVPAPALREQVRAMLRRLIGRRDLDVDVVSRSLHLSPRTLQRRLEAEGTHFRRLLDAVRYEIAVERVRAGVTVREASKAAGFAEPASFCRAFRRWTGRTPQEFRTRSELRAQRQA